VVEALLAVINETGDFHTPSLVADFAAILENVSD